MASSGTEERFSPPDGPADQLADAAAAAAGLPSLEGRGLRVSAARRAVLQIARPQLTLGQIGRALDVSRETLRRLASQPPNAQLVRAIRLQLGLRRAIAEAATGAFVARRGNERLAITGRRSGGVR